MANRNETHAWFDGEGWNLYTERAADIRRFEGWFGKPTRRGRDGACAGWEGLPKDALRLRRKAKRTGGGNPAALAAARARRSAGV